MGGGITAFGFAGILSAISSVCFGAFVFTKSPSRDIGRIWFLFSLSVGAWGFCNFFIPGISNEQSAYIAWKITYAISANWIAVLFYHFVTVFLDVRRPVFLTFQYLIALSFFVISPTHLIYSGVWKIAEGFYYCKAGPLYVIDSTWWVALVIYSHFELFRARKSIPEFKRLQVKYFFLASAIGFSGGSMSFFPPLGLRIYPWGNFAIVVYPLIMSYAILRFRLWQILKFTWDNNLILRNITVLSIGVFLLGVPGAVLIWFSMHSWSASLLGLLGPLIGYTLFLSLRQKVVGAVNGLPLFRGRYRSLGDPFQSTVASSGSISHWASNLVNEVGGLLNVEGAAVFLYDEAGKIFMPKAHWGNTRTNLVFCGPDRDDALISALSRAQGPIDKEFVRHSSLGKEGEQALFSFELMQSVLCAPFFDNGSVIGFLSLGQKIPKRGYHFFPSQINLKKMQSLLRSTESKDPNLRFVNTQLLGTTVNKIFSVRSSLSQTELSNALNNIVDAHCFWHNLPQPSLLKLNMQAVDLLVRRKDDGDISSSRPLSANKRMEVKFLNYSILASIYADAIEPLLKHDPFNEEDVKLVNMIVQRAQGTLTVILRSLVSQAHVIEWAHDLRHPFGPKGSLRLIRELIGMSKLLPPEGLKNLLAIRDDIVFVGKHLDKILQPDVAEGQYQISLGPMKAIYERIREDYCPFAEEKEIEWIVNVPGDDISVFRDEEVVKYRVIPNYLNNAFRLTPRKGRIELGYTIADAEFIGFVRDTGPGITDDLLNKIFERGVQGTKSTRGAKGIGLYNVKKVVEAQKGRVWVESEIGKGSTFYFSLPLQKVGNT